MLTTTLNAIREHRPCADGWEKLLKHLGKTRADDEPLAFSEIARSNGLADALGYLRVLPDSYRPQIVMLACDFAERALRFVPEGENRPRIAIETARRWANGEATREEVGGEANAAFAAYARSANAYAADAAYAAGAAAAAVYANVADDAVPPPEAAAADAAADATSEYEDEQAWQLQHFLKWADEQC